MARERCCRAGVVGMCHLQVGLQQGAFFLQLRCQGGTNVRDGFLCPIVVAALVANLGQEIPGAVASGWCGAQVDQAGKDVAGLAGLAVGQQDAAAQHFGLIAMVADAPHLLGHHQIRYRAEIMVLEELEQSVAVVGIQDGPGRFGAHRCRAKQRERAQQRRGQRTSTGRERLAVAHRCLLPQLDVELGLQLGL